MDRQTRWFRRLLKLLPADFQADYARDMERTFRAQHREAAGRGGRGVAALWWETLADLARTAPREHLDQLRQDTRFAIRGMARQRTFVLVAIVTLMLGFGAAATVLAVVNGVLIAPLPYPAGERLVAVWEQYQTKPEPSNTGFATFADWRDGAHSFSDLVALASWSGTVQGDNGPEHVAGMRVSWTFLRALGVRPLLGRDFTAGDDTWTTRRVVILSHGLWTRRFSANPDVIGKPTRIDGREYTVIGVMPRGFRDLISTHYYGAAEMWAPIGYDVSLPWACRTCRHIRVLGRLRADVDLRTAQEELSTIIRNAAQASPQSYANPSAIVVPLDRQFAGPVRRALLVLLAAVGLLLAIAAINVLNLLLVRTAERRQELAVRAAIGISRARLLRQLFTESSVLVGIGVLTGILLAAWSTSSLVAAAPQDLPRLDEIRVDGFVVAAIAGVGALVAALFALASLWHVPEGDADTLRLGARSSGDVGSRRLRSLLVAVNVALALVLLAGAGLLTRSLQRLLAVEPGFQAADVITAHVTMSGPRYDEMPQVAAFARAVLERVRAQPGVESAAFASRVPMSGGMDAYGLHVPERPHANPEDAPSAERFGVTADYFRVMRIPLMRGRAFSEGDRDGAPRVVIINDVLAREVFAGDDPLGRRIVLGGPDGPPRTVVGVVSGVRHRGLDAEPGLQVYVPLTQWPREPLARLVVRVHEGASAPDVRGAVAAVDRTQTALEVRALDDLVRRSTADRRFLQLLIAAFAALAVVLAAVCLYGVLSYSVTQRAREIGVRLALGGTPGEIRRLVIVEGMRPALGGLAAGTAASLIVGQLTAAVLFDVSARDPLTLAITAVALGAVALGACALAARRATRVDPIIALRAE